MSLVLLFLLGTFLYIYFWIKNRRNFWKELGFDHVELELPFGSFKGAGTKKSITIAVDEYYRKFKGKAKAVGLFSFVSPLLLIIDCDLLKKVLIQNFDSFHDRYLYYNKKDDPISFHLLAMKGKEWRDRRAKLTSTFTSGKIKMMYDIVNEISDKLVNNLETTLNSSQKSIEMHDLVARFTTDVISSVAFGLDSNSLNNVDAEMRKYGKETLNFNFLQFLKFQFTCSFPDLSRKLHLTANKSSVIDFFYNTFRENIEQREQSQSIRKDFLQILVELKKSSALSVEELAAESFIFFFGGFETSSTLISFALYELALNPDIQARLRDEIRESFEENNGNLTYELINSMKYLDMVVNESLRKFPPSFNLQRLCTKDFYISGTDLVIPKGTKVWINIFSLHRDPEYYPDAERFDPERFSPENVKSRPQCAFMPFGDGPRRCIGSRFGLLQSKLGLVKLIHKYEFSPCDKTSIPIRFSPTAVMLQSADHMWLNVRKVDN